jgi:hypothetical protein
MPLVAEEDPLVIHNQTILDDHFPTVSCHSSFPDYLTALSKYKMISDMDGR